MKRTRTIRFFCTTTLFAVLLHCAITQEDTTESWPVEISITHPDSSVIIQRPVGVVANLGTTIFIATTSGQLFLADVKTGVVHLMNRGGDDQRFGGLCLDSRGPGTLYATGSDTGVVYAFNRRGELLQKYRIAADVADGGASFLTTCIQTQYQLIIIDSYNPVVYYLPLADDGPLRGYPPELDQAVDFQGFQVPFAGEWEQIDAPFNAYGVEWTSKHNETAYVMNSASGQLYTCSISENRISGEMVSVNVIGSMKLFPGSLQILFDSRNENIMYITLPHLNAVAVLEFAAFAPRRAKFIRMLTSSLLRGPLAMSEYGDFVYPVNGMFSAPTDSAPTYSLVKISRHQQVLDSGNPDQQFTTIFDDVEQKPLPTFKPISEIVTLLQEEPAAVGTSAPVAIGTAPPPLSSPLSSPSISSDNVMTPSPGTENTGPGLSTSSVRPSAKPTPAVASPSKLQPSSVFAINDVDTETDTASCFPASATAQVERRGVVRMDELEIGDRVLTGIDEHGQQSFSEVFFFSHQDKTVISTFLRIRTFNHRMLEVTPSHYLYVNGSLSTAKTVRVGDIIDFSNGTVTRVERVEHSRRQGLFNPQTIHGNIVVNGVRISTYTSAVQPVVANALLTPFRALHQCNMNWSAGVRRWFHKGGGGFEKFLPQGMSSYT